MLLRKIKIIYSNPICIILIAILVCVLVIGRYIVQNTYDIDELAFLFCNALVFGLPMLLTGMLLSRYEERITKSLSLCVNILILVVGLVVMVIEFIFSGQYMDFHFSTYILSCAVFMFAFTYKRDGIVLKNALSYTGRRLSLWIYLDHIFVNSFLNFIEESTGIKENQVVTLMHPFLVILLSVLMAFAIDKIKSRNRVKNA